MALHDNLKNCREEKGLSQIDVANRLHVSRQTISKWETGKSFPDIESIIMFSDIYDISLDELLKEEKAIVINDPDNHRTDESQLMMIISVISLIAPLGFFIALMVMFFNKTHYSKYRTIRIICICSIVINFVELALRIWGAIVYNAYY